MPDLKVAMHMARVYEPSSPALVLLVRNFIIYLFISRHFTMRCRVSLWCW